MGFGIPNRGANLFRGHLNKRARATNLKQHLFYLSLLGNDLHLSGDKVLVNPFITETLCMDH